jgi:uncharacterized protein
MAQTLASTISRNDEGKVVTYHNDRKVKEEAFCSGGKIVGKYKYWYDNGQIAEESFYQCGKLEGEYKCWYKNGKLKEQAFFRNGLLEGKRTTWFDDGKLDEQEVYQAGQLKNIRKSSACGFDIHDICDDNGKPIERRLYTCQYYYRGKMRDRLVTQYFFHDDGIMECKTWYHYHDKKLAIHNFNRNGLKDGKHREWYENGQIRHESHYKNGKLEGEFKDWNFAGTLTGYLYCMDDKIMIDKFSAEKKYAFLNLKRRLYFRRTLPAVNPHFIPDLSKIICEYVSG